MTTLELTIDDLGAQGDGIAHYRNATLFVAGALPGERVRIEIDGKGELVQRGKLLEIVRESPLRVKPPCPHFPQCGGCRFQHLNDEGYTNHKLGQLQQTFLMARMKTPPFLPAVVTVSGTRRRARLAVKRDRKGIVIGFNEWRSHTIVDVKTCPVLLPELVETIQNLRGALESWLPLREECDIQITALAEGIDVLIIGGPKLGLAEREALAQISEKLGIAHISWRKFDRSPVEPIAHRTPLTVTHGGIKLPFPPGSFLQATAGGERALIDFVRGIALPGQKALDLFCGLGGFGLSLQDPGFVRFADLDGPAIEALQRGTRSQPRVEVVLRNLIGDPFSADELNDFDFVVFDPPRGGAKAQALQLAKSKVPSIAAISCDPQSFVRDAKILMEGGYRMESLLPVDQFLWSPHMELAAHFTR